MQEQCVSVVAFGLCHAHILHLHQCRESATLTSCFLKCVVVVATSCVASTLTNGATLTMVSWHLMCSCHCHACCHKLRAATAFTNDHGCEYELHGIFCCGHNVTATERCVPLLHMTPRCRWRFGVDRALFASASMAAANHQCCLLLPVLPLLLLLLICCRCSCLQGP